MCGDANDVSDGSDDKYASVAPSLPGETTIVTKNVTLALHRTGTRPGGGSSSGYSRGLGGSPGPARQDQAHLDFYANLR